MRYLSRAILPGGLGFAVAVLVAACGGGSGLLSANQSTDLNHQLDTVASAINAGHCTTAAAAAQGFDNSVANLTTVNPTLTSNLKQASSALAQQAGPDCQNQQTASPPTTTMPKTTSSTTTTTTPKTTPSTPSTTNPTTSTPTNTATGPANTPTSPATTTPSPGNTTTNGGSGGAGVGGTGTSTGGSGGASPGSG